MSDSILRQDAAALREAPSALREPWEDLDRQRDAAIFGIWTFLASELLFFGGMILVYSACRFTTPTGFFAAAKLTNIYYGTINTLLLMTSSFAMTLATRAAQARLRRFAVFCLLATAGFGLAFLVCKGLEYREDIAESLYPGRDFPIALAGAQLFFGLYWVLTGVHAIHLTIGIALILRLALVAGRRDLSVDSPEVQVTALYWRLVDVVWLFLYALLYLGGRT